MLIIVKHNCVSINESIIKCSVMMMHSLCYPFNNASTVLQSTSLTE